MPDTPRSTVASLTLAVSLPSRGPERLVLRCLTGADVPGLHRCTGDPAVMRYWYPGPDAGLAATASRVAEIDRHWREHGFGDWAVLERETGELIGLAGLHRVPGVAEVNVGYALLPRCWGRGFGRELCSALVAHGLSVLGLPEVVAVVDPRNGASIAVALHAGMRYRRDFLWHGQPRLCFAMTRAEYAQAVETEQAQEVRLHPVVPADLPDVDAWASTVGDQMSRTRPYLGGADRHDPGAGLHWHVIALGGTRVGTVWIELTPAGDEAVLGIYLGDPSLSGRGTGSAAIRLALAEFAAAHPRVPVVLRVRRSNVRARSCYRRVGFTVGGSGSKTLPSGEVVLYDRMVFAGTARTAVDLPHEVVDRVAALAADAPLVLVGVDGRGGAGKSHWAAALAAALEPVRASVVHMDDFYLPSAQRPGGAATPAGGAFDWRRLRDDVLAPLRSGHTARFAPYDWRLDELAGQREVAPRGVVIVEGVSATRRELSGLYDLRVWVDCPREVRLARGLARDGEDAREIWEGEWMPAEDRYVREHRPDECADVRVDGTASAPGPALEVRDAAPEERVEVARFLRETGYGGDVLPSDRLVLAVRGGAPAGAFRLAHEEDVLVLRGMRVREDLRRAGVGRRLLGALAGVDEPCFCVPHAYLEGFYGGAGFVRLPEAETPGFLGDRAQRYRDRGLDVIVMRRDPATA